MPAGVTSIPGDQSVALSWQPVPASDLAGYTVYQATSVDGPWMVASGVEPITANTWTATGLINRNAYWFAVTATDTSRNRSGYSDVVSDIPDNYTGPNHCGTLTRDEVWGTSAPHVLDCTVTVPSGVKLTVNAGASINAGPLAGLTVDGALEVSSTGGAPAVFRPHSRLSDPLTARSLSAQGNSGSASWPGLVVREGATATLNNVDISQADIALHVLQGASANIHGKVTNSRVGVSAAGYVDATAVDWGDPSGPSPLGSGAPVVGSGVEVVPWSGYNPPAQPDASPPGVVPWADPDEATSGCRKVMFLAARGSGEDPKDEAGDAHYENWLSGFGPNVWKIYNGFTTRLEAKGITAQERKGIGLRYRAMHVPVTENTTVVLGPLGGINAAFANANFLASIWQGVDRIEQYLDEEAANCEDQQFVLAGYSQGALAIHLYLNLRADDDMLDRIAAVGLLADPAKNAYGSERIFTNGFTEGDENTHAAAGAYRRAGLSGGGHLPYELTARTASLCHRFDIVCATGDGASEGPHSNYTDHELRSLGTWLADTATATGGVQIPSTKWASLEGMNHFCGIRAGDRSAWCWRQDDLFMYDADPIHGETWGALGTGRDVGVSERPLRVAGGGVWKSLSVGNGLSCGIQIDGSAWCWGYGHLGQIGDGILRHRSVPTLVQVAEGETWRSVSAGGGNHACGIKNDGTAWCWGQNILGALGTGDDVSSAVPVPVSGGHQWRTIATGSGNTCGIAEDRTAWCWGANWYGALGVGHSGHLFSPTPVSGGGEWTSISLGSDHTCGVQVDGSGWCWGESWEGQLGTGEGYPWYRETPQRVLGDGNWSHIEASDWPYTCGIRVDGRAWCWGQDGYNNNDETPTPLGGGEQFLAVTPGSGLCVLRTDQTAHCWTYDRTAPVPVPPAVD